MQDTATEAMNLFAIYQDPTFARVTALIIAALFVAAVIGFSFFSNMLRDQSVSAKKPYSLSRTQLMWWTFIIGLCVILYVGAHGEVPAITGTCLVLLGIGAATTVSARIVDNRQRENAEARGSVPLHQDEPSKDMITDMLSDEGGLSVHRFQSFIFNLVYGIAFLYTFGNTSEFPVYNAEALALLGISSAGYVGLKVFENSTPTRTGQNDELLDATVPPGMGASG
jgi:hypothetical protein